MMKLIVESMGKNLFPVQWVVSSVVLDRLVPTRDMTKNCLIQGYSCVYSKVRFVFTCCMQYIMTSPLMQKL